MTTHVPDIDGSPVKGWCPGALKPMRSGDGLVVRVRTGPIVSRDLARALADLSRLHGNGQIDLTQRGNLQLRGVTDESWPLLIAALSDLGVLDEDAGVEAVRNIIVSPLAGLDPSAAFDGLAAWLALNNRILADPVFRQLPGKFGFLIDDGGALPLVDAATDVHFRGCTQGVAVEIGGRIGLAVIAADEIADVAARLAAAFLALRGETRRLAATAGVVGVEAIRAQAGLGERPLPEPDVRPRRDVVGALTLGSRPSVAKRGGVSKCEGVAPHASRRPLSQPPQHEAGEAARNGTAITGVGIPFGRISADMLDALAASAAEIRLTPWRAVLLTGDVDISGLDAASFILSRAMIRVARLLLAPARRSVRARRTPFGGTL